MVCLIVFFFDARLDFGSASIALIQSINNIYPLIFTKLVYLSLSAHLFFLYPTVFLVNLIIISCKKLHFLWHNKQIIPAFHSSPLLLAPAQSKLVNTYDHQYKREYQRQLVASLDIIGSILLYFNQICRFVFACMGQCSLAHCYTLFLCICRVGIHLFFH